MAKVQIDYGKLKKGFKNRWLKALRTPPDEGGYLQTTEVLYSPQYVSLEDFSTPTEHDSFCCLGVAVNLLAEEGKVAWTDIAWSKDTKYLDPQHWERLDYVTDISPSLEAWAENLTNGKPYRLVTDDEFVNVYDEALETAGLPGDEVLNLIGLTPAAACNLAKMNDEGKTFTEIAAWIEATL